MYILIVITVLSLGGMVDGKDEHISMQEFATFEACNAGPSYILASTPKNVQAKCLPKGVGTTPLLVNEEIHTEELK